MSKGIQPDDELAGVAVLGADDEMARAIVERLLAAAGIDCAIEGSVVYAVQVRPPDVARAEEILRSAPELQEHWIQFPSG
jgi:hypothetical protein